jgi:hypothetical protein
MCVLSLTGRCSDKVGHTKLHFVNLVLRREHPAFGGVLPQRSGAIWEEYTLLRFTLSLCTFCHGSVWRGSHPRIFFSEAGLGCLYKTGANGSSDVHERPSTYTSANCATVQRL